MIDLATVDKTRMGGQIWICPPITTRTSTNSLIESYLRSYISQTVEAGDDYIKAFGRERRCSTSMLKATNLFDAYHPRWRVKAANLFYRPLFEPAVAACARSVDKPDLTNSAVLDIASRLLGRSAELRVNAGVGVSEAGNVFFPPVPDTSAWLANLNHAWQSEKSGWEAGFLSYAVCILQHPLRDGNGRLARSLLAIGLQRDFGAAASLLPLAPAIYLNSREMTKALSDVVEFSNWSHFVEELVGTVKLACDLYRCMARDGVL